MNDSNTASTDSSYNYKQLLCFFSQSDHNQNINVEKRIDVKDKYSVQEYYGTFNKEKDNLHFIVQDKYVFKCTNVCQKQLWIQAIIDTNVYYGTKNDMVEVHNHRYYYDEKKGREVVDLNPDINTKVKVDI